MAKAVLEKEHSPTAISDLYYKSQTIVMDKKYPPPKKNVLNTKIKRKLFIMNSFQVIINDLY